MKYIDAEKLIAEIERLLAEAKNDEEKAFAKIDAAGHLAAVTKTTVCVKIKKLITSLQQEQPSLLSNLDEAAKIIAYDVCKQLPNGTEKDSIIYYAILAAIAGAEWMAGQISKAE